MGLCGEPRVAHNYNKSNDTVDGRLLKFIILLAI